MILFILRSSSFQGIRGFISICCFFCSLLFTVFRSGTKFKRLCGNPLVFCFTLVCCFCLLNSFFPHAKDNSFYSSSDSEDEDEPRKFHVEIKPVQPNNGTHQSRATIDELKASIGNIILSPSTSVQLFKPNFPTQTCCCPDRKLHKSDLLVNTRGQQ